LLSNRFAAFAEFCAPFAVKSFEPRIAKTSRKGRRRIRHGVLNLKAALRCYLGI
jgi:hypothetical protein